MAGGCCIKSYSKGQGVVSVSSGESEYYALVSSARSLLGQVSTANDCGLQTENEVFMDASARRGLGKAKYVDTQYHWVQDRVAMPYFRLKKVGTDEMLADVLTKPVTEEKMNKALRGMNFHFGRRTPPDPYSLEFRWLELRLRQLLYISSSPYLMSHDLDSGGVTRYTYSQ